ncbi:hypothetical protein BS017_RS23210 [Vibrio parahaemolyticus]|uniref:hypothetical protein n=1 Tax=Vibrio campbellii TaxID=680 RepID=UPI0039090E35|nr:hypothetical protein [Vibrio parahaemolyticus]EJG2040356.1 hypothetical protein [Vibrio parahaemolyticus]EJG2045035.1 hypothetical protein [Vibrio parahaemolyticus]EJG2235785.1 hypothetical protein [Vibrio parahaemolyticus]
MKKEIKKYWADPVWSKVIATAIIALVTGLVAKWTVIASFLESYLPNWMVYVLAFCIFSASAWYLSRWVISSKNEKKSDVVYVREDVLAKIAGANQTLCFTCFDYNRDMTLQELIEKVTDNFVEYALHEMEYGKDWVLISLTNRVVLNEKHKYKTLAKLGVSKNSVLEAFPYFTKEKMQSFPPHPSLCYHPNHYRGD